MRMVLLAATLVLCAASYGCADMETGGTRMVSADKSECLVCKHNADLACVEVKVDVNTPRAEYQGKTYYFCSDTCRQEFLKNPAKYVADPGR